MRFALMGLLAFGVVAGYGSAIARAAHGGGGCHSRGGWHDARWQDSRFGSRFDEARSEVKQAAPVPQTIVVQQPAPAAAPAPQIFVIMPGAQAAPSQPQTIVVPAVAVPAVAASPAPPQ